MSKLLKSKFFFGVMIVAVMFAVVGVSTAAAYVHTTTLKMGSTGSQVMALQQALNAAGFMVSSTGAGSPGMESTYFGEKTKGAVVAFQTARGLGKDGIVGPNTGAALGGVMSGNFPAGCTSAAGYSTVTGLPCTSGPSTGLPAGCSSTVGYSPTTGHKCDGSSTPSTGGPLQGGAGDITLDAQSDYSGEEVGEDEEDVKIMAFDVEADDESDVEINSVKVEFYQDETTDSQDLTDYAESVSIWFNGDKVGEADASDFSEDSDYYTKSISLDGAVIDAGETAEFVVAVTGLNNLDSGDIDTDDWSVDLLSVRFTDGDGVTTTESGSAAATDGAGAYEKSFNFASFATAADAELSVSLNDDDDAINEAHVINVDATADTDNVEILSFTLEAEGDSDLNVTEIPVLITTTEAAGTDFNDPDDVIVNATLWMNGEEIASESLLTSDADGDTEVVTFDDLDIDIGAGDTEEFMIKLDLQDLASALDVGDTIMADLDATRVDLIEVEDESGEELVAADLTGTADGEASEVRDIGFNVDLVSTTAVISHTGDIAGSGAGDDDQATFTITFDVTAFDGDVYIDATSPTLTGGTTEADLDLVTTGTVALTSAILTSPTGATLSGTINADARFLVNEDETERFTVTVVSTVSADGLTHLELDNILYALTDVDGDIAYTFNLEDYKTSDILMNAN